jgi:hypothetical protein
LAIPVHADTTDAPELEQRLYPPLIAKAEEGEHDVFEVENDQADWQEIIVPELRELFEGSVGKVKTGLKKLAPAPYENLDADDPDVAEEADDDEEEEDKDKQSEDAMAGNASLQEAPPPERAVPNFKLVIPRTEAEDWYRAMNQARMAMTQKSLWIEDDGNLHGPFLDQMHYEIYTQVQEWLVQHVLSEQ